MCFQHADWSSTHSELCVRLEDCLFNTGFAFDCKQRMHTHTHTHTLRHSDPHNQLATCSLVISANISITPCSVCSSLSFPVVLKVFIFPSLFMCVCRKPWDGNSTQQLNSTRKCHRIFPHAALKFPRGDSRFSTSCPRVSCYATNAGQTNGIETITVLLQESGSLANE